MQPKILIIDDERDILELLKVSLTNANYQVFTAESGNTGIDLALKVNPDIILIDVVMPGMDGFKTCKRLHDATISSKLIVMTAKIDAVDALKARQNGADDFTVKTQGHKAIKKAIAENLQEHAK